MFSGGSELGGDIESLFRVDVFHLEVTRFGTAGNLQELKILVGSPLRDVPLGLSSHQQHELNKNSLHNKSNTAFNYHFV